MSDWRACFEMQEGKTYRIRYVRHYENVVREGIYHFNGEVISGGRAIVVMEQGDTTSVPGPIHILAIDEVSAPGDIKESY